MGIKEADPLILSIFFFFFLDFLSDDYICFSVFSRVVSVSVWHTGDMQWRISRQEEARGWSIYPTPLSGLP